MDEKQYLRDLAQRQAELAAHPDNAALAQAWYDHNSLRGQRPMVVFEEETCKQEFFQLQCEDPLARYVEGQLLQTIRAKELIGDDKVVPDFFGGGGGPGLPRRAGAGQPGGGFVQAPSLGVPL